MFTGIGSAGAVGLGILVSGDPLDAIRLAGIALIVGGVLVLRAAAG